MNKVSIEEELKTIEEMASSLLKRDGMSFEKAMDFVRKDEHKLGELDYETLAADHGYCFPGLYSIFRCRSLLDVDPDGLVDEGHEVASYWLCRAIADVWAWWGFEGMRAARNGRAPEEMAAQFRRDAARVAASARHAEDREIAERIKRWYRENGHRYRSLDSAAESAIRIEPVAFRTARKHIGDEAKNMRSARKA